MQEGNAGKFSRAADKNAALSGQKRQTGVDGMGPEAFVCPGEREYGDIMTCTVRDTSCYQRRDRQR